MVKQTGAESGLLGRAGHVGCAVGGGRMKGFIYILGLDGHVGLVGRARGRAAKRAKR